MSAAPWASLPPGLAETLRPALPGLADEIMRAIRSEVADYARPFEGQFGRAVQVGVERALSRFLDLIASPETEDERGRRVYVELGRGEFREGRSLDALLSAYRVGARIAWRRFVETGKRADVDPDVLYQLGEAIFAYIDGLSAESIEGYTQAQSAAAGERQRLRRQLVELLQREPAPDRATVDAVAEQVGWPLPAELAALVVADSNPATLAGRLGEGALVAELEDGLTLALVADPDAPRRRPQLERAAGGQPAALGPIVGWPQARRSIEQARRTLALIEAGVLAGPFALARDHLPALLIHADAELARDLARTTLAPLDALAAGSRAKLRRTLAAWLDHRGRVEEVAHVLAVHPQTVRYRLNQLRELFGPALEDPEGRFALTLALRADSPPAART